MPRSSIVITTRNRSDLVVNSLQSAVQQDYEDVEIIVSDNSDDDIASQVEEAIKPFLDDPRVRYIRPERLLPMTAHWEWAVDQTTGDYVGILTDRMLLKLYALSTISAIIDAAKPAIIAYERENLIERADSYAVRSAGTSEVVVATRMTAKIVESFSRADFRPMDTPRFLNSFASQSFLARLKQEYGSVFTGIAPDYGFLMRVLDCLEDFPFIETPLLVKHSEGRSNGKSFTHLSITDTARDFIDLATRDQKQFLEFSPIPDDKLMITNVMMREYEIGRRNQKSGKFPPFNAQSFYSESMRHLNGLNRTGRDIEALLERLEIYRKSNKLLRYRTSWMDKRRAVKAALRQLAVASGLKKQAPNDADQFFTSMLSALQFDACNHQTRPMRIKFVERDM